jgi:uncharacterized protein
VLARHSGALAKMLLPFQLGLGGPVAGGRQYLPWIHLDDVAGALVHCVTDERVAGPVNLTAVPVTNRDFSRALGRALRRPAVLPIPGFGLWLLYGEMSMVIVTGQRAVPTRLAETGFRFRHGDLEPALRDVLSQK